MYSLLVLLTIVTTWLCSSPCGAAVPSWIAYGVSAAMTLGIHATFLLPSPRMR